MSHEGDAASLRRRAENGNLALVLVQVLEVLKHGLPRCRSAGILVVLDGIELGAEPGVALHDTSESDLEERHLGGTEAPEEVSGASRFCSPAMPWIAPTGARRLSWGPLT